MQSYLMEAICKTGIFIICAQVLIHFRPKASYDKYLKMLVSAMILIQLFMPVSELFTGDGEQTLAERIGWFEEELARCMEEGSWKCEEEITGFGLGMQEGEKQVFDEAALDEARAGDRKLSVPPIAPIESIEIRVGKGDEADADISTRNYK